MRLLRASIAVALLAVFGVACSEQNAPTAADESLPSPAFHRSVGKRHKSVYAAVKEIVRQYASSLNAEDVDAWMSMWTDDGIQLPPGAPPVVGKEAIRAGLEFEVSLFDFEDMEITLEEVSWAGGHLAYAWGTYTVTLIPWGGGDPIYIDGKFMTVFERQWGGSWKIHRDMFNSNV